MRLGHIIHYSEVFTDEPIPEFKDVLTNVPTGLALEYFCFMSARLHMNPMAPSNQTFLLKELSEGLSQQTENKLKIAASRQIFAYGGFYLFDTYAFLKVINYLIANKNEDKRSVSDLRRKDKEAIFRAVLVANQIINEEYKINLKGIEHGLEKFCRIIWPNVTVSSDFRLRNDFEMLSFKAVTFIDYIAEKPEIFKHFVKYFGISNKEEAMKFVSNILSFYLMTGINKQGEVFHHAFDFDIEAENPVVGRYVLDLYNYDVANFNHRDFKTLRETPIIKIREKRYDIVNWNFLLEKLNTGLLFDLFFKTDLHKDYLDRKGKPRFDSFKSNVGFYYSEKTFQNIFSKSVVKSSDYYHSGNAEVEAESDSYLRRGNRIALIEYKDPLMVKNLEYEKIKVEVDSKLNTDGKGTHQLMKLLDKLANDICTFEPHLKKKINTKKIVIYPIIAISEALFTSPGFSQYLNKEFKKLIAEKDYPFYVKPLIAIDFDFFFQMYDKFITGDADFFECLELHYRVSIEKGRRARKGIDVNTVARSFDGFRENVWKVLPRNSIRKGKLGTLGQYAIDRLNLPKN